jgi:hypothetical protein
LIGAPTVLGRLVWMTFQTGVVLPSCDFLELFAGRKAITNAMRARNLIAVSYELHDNEHLEYFCSASGFVHAVRCVLAIVAGGGFTLINGGNPAHRYASQSQMFGASP